MSFLKLKNINNYLDKLSGQFQIIRKPLPIDNLRIKIEKSQNTSSIEADFLKNRLISDFKNNLYILPQIDFAPHGSLTEDGTKSKMIKKNIKLISREKLKILINYLKL